MDKRLYMAVCAAGFFVSGPAFAVTQEQLELEARRQARSVHLGWQGADGGVAFYNEVKVLESVPGSYFCVSGFSGGYFGMQELANGKKVVIFSVWEPANAVNPDDPSKTDASKRTKLVYQGEGVRVGRFGGEGTGGQSFFDYEWKAQETYRYVVHARPDGERTVFTGYFYLNEAKSWKRLVSFSALAPRPTLGGLYSFIEDFRRDFKSANERRQALFGHAWLLDGKGAWLPVTAARFTADRNPVLTINAGLRDGWFFLETGGGVANVTPLHTVLRQGPGVEGLSFE